VPHQCLGCGFAFEEGSSDLLNGCPQCKGTRFFYSAAPVPDAERKRIQAKAQKDMHQVVAELLQEAAPNTAQELLDRADADGWATLRPRDIRRFVRKAQMEKSARAGDLREEPADSRRRLRAAAEARERILAELEADSEESRPDTVTIEAAGRYAIDVKALLEHNPIIVHKDGAYVIHLPSLFRRV
jgi:predicted  nucleic acid-binding Zn-ribbon protein